MQLGPLYPDRDRGPFGIPREQRQLWARWAFFVAASTAIIVVALVGVSAKEPWLWALLSR